MIFDVKNFPVFSFIKDGDIVNNGDILYNADKEWLTELSGYRPDKYLTNILRNNLTFIKKTMADASKNIFYVSSDLMKEMQSEIEGYNTLFDSDYKKISQYCKYNRSKCMPMPCILIWHDNKQHQHVSPPTRRCGLKLDENGKPTKDMRSPPTRRCGLKHR